VYIVSIVIVVNYFFLVFSIEFPQQSVGIATGYGAGRSGDRIPVGARFSAPVQTGPGAHPASCTMHTGSSPEVKSGRSVTLTLQVLLVPWSRKSRSIPLLPLWAVRPVESLSACRVQLYLYSPYGPYDLCRASVPVQYSYTSTPLMGRTAYTEPQCLYSRAIPLLPLWAVRHVQSLSSCTVQLNLYTPMDRTACTVQLYLYCSYGSYGMYRASVPLQHSNTSIPPMDLTACTLQL